MIRGWRVSLRHLKLAGITVRNVDFTALTLETEAAANRYIRQIDDMGGMIVAIEQGFPQKEIAAWELAVLLEGIDFSKGKRRKRYALPIMGLPIFPCSTSTFGWKRIWRRAPITSRVWSANMCGVS